MHGSKRTYIQCHLQQKWLDVMVASWACEVTEMLTQRRSEEAS